MTNQASLQIPAGTRFGYHSGLPWKRVARCLAAAGDDIHAGVGLHLFVAPNGTGKTTLLRTLAGLCPVLQGQVKALGEICYVADELRADPEMKAGAFFRAWFKNEALDLTEELAETLKLSLTTPIGRLSRGNRQKVLIIYAEVKASLSKASILLMDEPLTGLDIETRDQIAQLWLKKNTSVLRLVIMHELECACEANSMLTITRGQLIHSTKRGASWLDTYRSLQS